MSFRVISAVNFSPIIGNAYLDKEEIQERFCEGFFQRFTLAKTSTVFSAKFLNFIDFLGF